MAALREAGRTAAAAAKEEAERNLQRAVGRAADQQAASALPPTNTKTFQTESARPSTKNGTAGWTVTSPPPTRWARASTS